MMGWDACAIYDGEPFRYVNVEIDQQAREFFRIAWERALEQGGTDGYLDHAGLDHSRSVEELAQATGETDRNAVWTPVMVREKLRLARWPDLQQVPLDERFAVISARVFLETYGIQFDL